MLPYEIDESCQLPHDILKATYDKYFPDRTDGTYVEVGAFDGVTFGVVSCLARAGWRGLCIEAHPEYAEMGRKKLAGLNVTFEACAAGDHDGGEITLFVYLACSSTKCNAITMGNGVTPMRHIQVPVFTLNTLLTRNGIRPGFEVLSVDVEEAELEVLAGFDLAHWRPKLVIIEAIETDEQPVRNEKGAEVRKIFTAAGYSKIYADQINTIYALEG